MTQEFCQYKITRELGKQIMSMSQPVIKLIIPMLEWPTSMLALNRATEIETKLCI